MRHKGYYQPGLTIETTERFNKTSITPKTRTREERNNGPYKKRKLSLPKINPLGLYLNSELMMQFDEGNVVGSYKALLECPHTITFDSVMLREFLDKNPKQVYGQSFIYAETPITIDSSIDMCMYDGEYSYYDVDDLIGRLLAVEHQGKMLYCTMRHMGYTLLKSEAEHYKEMQSLSPEEIADYRVEAILFSNLTFFYMTQEDEDMIMDFMSTIKL